MGSNIVGSGRKVISGKKFNQLTLIKEVERINGIRYVECLCDCGKKIITRAWYVFSGHSKTCGCLKREAGMINKTHGEAGKTIEYKTWCGIIRRCYNKNDNSYKRYGGKGIKVSDEWKYSYETFLNDMGRRPNGKYSIERKNFNGDYCKENCCWATCLEQANNKRNNYLITHLGETKTMAQWAKLYKTKYTTFANRFLNLCDKNFDVLIFKFYPQFLYLKNKDYASN